MRAGRHFWEIVCEERFLPLRGPEENEDREVLSKWLMLVSTSGSFDLHEWGMDRGNRGVEPGEGAGAPSCQRRQENGQQGPGNHCCRNLVAFGHVRMRT